MISKSGNFGQGYTEVSPSLGREWMLTGIVITSNGSVRVRIGPQGGPWISPDIFIQAGVPYVLPLGGDWMRFTAGSQVGIECAFTSGNTIGVCAQFEFA